MFFKKNLLFFLVVIISPKQVYTMERSNSPTLDELGALRRLNSAVEHGRPDIIDHELDQGLVSANGLESNFDSLTPLGLAATLYQVQSVAKLLERGANPNRPFGSTTDSYSKLASDEVVKVKTFPLLEIGYLGDGRGLNILKKFIDFGADVNVCDELGKTALIRVIAQCTTHCEPARKEALSAAYFIVHHGAQLNHQSHDGKNALTLALELQEQCGDSDKLSDELNELITLISK